MLFTKEHDQLMQAFERDARGRLDKEDKNLWPRGNVYQDGHVNDAFKAFRAGYSFGKAVALAELRDEISALHAENDRLTAMLTQQSQGTTEQECQHEYRLERVGAGVWFACQKCGEILDED